MKTSVVLIGFMGTGKSAVGEALAKRLGTKYVELDTVIAARGGKPIVRIFAEDGEIHFRELEIGAVKDIAPGKNQVIAAGGGVVLNKINIDRFKENARVVYLTATPAEIIRRVSGDRSRPLMNTEDRAGRVRELLAFRKPLYERAADITIQTTRKKVDAVVDEIIERLKEDADFSFKE